MKKPTRVTRRFAAVGVLAFLLGGLLLQPSATATGPQTHKDVLTKLAQSPVSRWLSAGGQQALRLALGSKPQVFGGSDASSPAARSSVKGARAPLGPPVANTRANTPAGDAVAELDMTTQSETSVA